MDSHRKKHNIMKIAIAFSALIIIFLWLANLDNVFQTTKKLNNDQDVSTWDDFKADIDKTVNDVSLYFDQKTQEKEVVENKVINDSPNTLVNDLIIATQELASSTKDTEEASNDPVVEQNNCPEWINCMPMIDTEPRPCQIPIGCEGITQIAY